jgi:hypothetical protein
MEDRAMDEAMSPFTSRQHMLRTAAASMRGKRAAARKRTQVAKGVTDAARTTNSSCLRKLSLLPTSAIEPLQLTRGRGCCSDGEGDLEEKTVSWPSCNPVDPDVFMFLAPKPAVTPSKAHVRSVHSSGYTEGKRCLRKRRPDMHFR